MTTVTVDTVGRASGRAEQGARGDGGEHAAPDRHDVGKQSRGGKMLKIASVLLGLLTLAGCARFEVNIDSISANASPRTKYILLPGNKDASPSDVQFKEYAAYINRALES